MFKGTTAVNESSLVAVTIKDYLLRSVFKVEDYKTVDGLLCSVKFGAVYLLSCLAVVLFLPFFFPLPSFYRWVRRYRDL